MSSNPNAIITKMKHILTNDKGNSNITNNTLLSNTISFLRFPLAVLIAFLHFNLTGGIGIQGVKHGINNPEWYYFVIRFISETLGALCVPSFFFISGFLLFGGKDFGKEIYKQKLVSRIRTLLIPYILWNLIALVWNLKRCIPYVSSFYQPAEIQFSLSRLINTLFCYTYTNGIIVIPSLSNISSGIYPINGPLWYVRDLMLLIIISPIIYKLIKTCGIWFVSFLCGVWFVSPFFRLSESYASLFIIALFFFSWGAFYSIYKKNIIICFRKYKYLPILYIIVAVTDTTTRVIDYNIYINNVEILLGVFSVFIISSYLLEFGLGKVNQTLANSSFFIFACHQMFLNDIGRTFFILLHIPESNPYIMLVFYFVVPLFTIMICLTFYMLLKRFFPHICNILTGGR